MTPCEEHVIVSFVDTSPGIRLQKYLAERGLASRRGAGEIIRDGRVTVNGEIVRTPGHRVSPNRDAVALDGRNVAAAREASRTILLNKPRGYICSTSTRPGGAPTVYALLQGVTERIVPVGRLDKDSEGLLLLSNDGALVQRLTHPRYGQRKRYEVTVRGTVSARMLQRLQSRLVLDGYRIAPVAVRMLRPSSDDRFTTMGFTLTEGRNRQIRKMCALVGLRVHRLCRESMGEISCKGLPEGAWRDLTANELMQLNKASTSPDAHVRREGP